MAYMRLGDLLLSSGVISHEQLERALELQKESKERLGDVLVQSGIITEQQLIEALKIQLGVEFVDLTAVSIPVELAKYVPRTLAKKYCVVPVKLVRDTLYLAMSDPLDFIAQEEVKAASKKRVIPMIATRRAVEQAILEAPAGAVIVLAGKGNDAIQRVRGGYVHYDSDPVVAKRALALREKKQ